MEGATSTLADNLLDDLDDLSDVDEDQEKEQKQEENDWETSPEDNNNNNNEEQDEGGADDSKPSARLPRDAAAPHGKEPLLDDATLQAHLATLDAWDEQESTSTDNNITSSKERADEEYQLIVKSNRWLTRLGDELAATDVALRAVYNVKFPELADLLPDARQYQQAVLAMGNETDVTRVGAVLQDFLSSHQVMTLTVAGSTTAGRPLTDGELRACHRLARYVERVHETRGRLVDFVAARMRRLAPAVCALTGPALAARLVALAGGLPELAVIPACNLQVMGQTKHTGASRAAGGLLGGGQTQQQQPHMGLLAQAPLVQSVPQTERRKVLKWVAAKVALAARCDATAVQQGRPRSAVPGERFAAELQKKIQQLQTPDQAPVLKALPKPDLKVRKRRGGKRIRRLKERFEETATMKQANTRAFSVQNGDYDDDAMGLSRGLLDTDGATMGGTMRRQTEKRKMRQANTKASRKKAAQMETAAKRHQQQSSNGLASTVTFTPLQGMELVNPEAQKDRVRQANQKWFTENAGFKSALPKK